MVYVKLVICMVYIKHHPNGSLKNIMAFSSVTNSPFPSSPGPLFQNEGRCSANKTQERSQRKVVHLASF